MMKAVAYYQSLPIDDVDALQDITLPDPVAGEHDLLVEVRAISVNPVDVKVRTGMAPPVGEARVLGWDASGVVRAVGSQVSLFRPGDRVWYAGSLVRPGSNSALQLVDERIVGRMPQSLDFADAAALPLTSITAWELLFDRLQVSDNRAPSGRTLLVVGAAGGVGSILLQLARQLTGLTVIATASRPETRSWVEAQGAHAVIDHRQPLSEALQAIGLGQVDYIVGLNHSEQHFPQMAQVIAPQGRIALIDDPASIDVRALKQKSASLHWEFMFTRAMFATSDMIEQHHLLNRVADLVDRGVLTTTRTQHLGPINAEQLRVAHRQLASGSTIGKLVLEGF
jgi:zinc-binding alcohol dehydrogenase family protein